MRTNKTIWRVLGISLALISAAGAGFAAETAAPARVAQPKFEVFDAAKYTGKTGKITLPYAGNSMILMRKVENGKLGDYMQVNGNQKTVVAPVGSYKLTYLSMSVKDKEGKQWSIARTPVSEDKALALNIKAGGTVTVNACEPINASIDVKQNADKVSMSLQMLGACGDKVTIMQTVANPETPGFQVLSKSGEVLMSGKFQYGWGGTCSYSGGIPSEVKGAVTVKPVINAGPFKVKTKDTAWTRQ